MAKNRVFTKEELKEMSRPILDVAFEAVRAGDKDKAENAIKTFAADAKMGHDAYMNQIATLLSHIYVNEGEEALYQAERKMLGGGIEAMSGLISKADVRQQVQMLLAGMRMHFTGFEMEEDDEKVSVKMAPCGAGQVLVESGAYGPPQNLCRVKAHRMTWGLPDFPIYCVHAPMMDIIAIEKIGRPMWVYFPAKEMATESCRFVIYKDPKSIPEEVYKRVGMEKPK